MDWPDLAGRLNGQTHELPVRVYYEDTDFTGIVYHGSYVRFFERGRSDLLRLAGINHADLRDGGRDGPALAFAVRRLNLDFLKTATIDDLLIVRTIVREHRGARIRLDQSIWRGDDLSVKADVEVAVITSAGRPTRLPSPAAGKLASLVSAGDLDQG
ncbi:tol-pal system-associated acyl-CoA thioesterase [Roseibium aquae]|uniref:Tol-pal system-associated acyl-CoA thioesterase n=1 Tax=Roseibium aquae TaxID=1323746 RepID=A0A916T5L5_9HYPH|nr:YbgC/FadM family acyl-CoA thioesterase [Roseibium aquae]GGB32835.1 tol-pal system-associated acyl-CoA thioesterase [Roseibium aquae]